MMRREEPAARTRRPRAGFRSLCLVGAITASLIASCPGTAAIEKNSPILIVRGNQPYPESAAWSAKRRRFFVGSVRHGEIGTVDRQGRYTILTSDPDLVSTFGVRVDDDRDRLWVAVGDRGSSARSTPRTTNRLAAAALYDARTGKRIGWFDLSSIVSGDHLVNDFAIGPAGEAYVTDSYAGVVYRIDPARGASVFARNDMFRTGPGVGLNGVVVHPGGFLLIGTHNTSELFRISLADPADVRRVPIAGIPKGMDGFVLDGPNRLHVAINASPGRVATVASDDGWKTARVARLVASLSTAPTAVTLVDGRLWVLDARLDTLKDPAVEKVDSFVLEQLGKVR